MTVRCIRVASDPDWGKTHDQLTRDGHSEYNCIQIDQEYLVYAVAFLGDMIGYCLCCDEYIHFPNWHMADYFEVTDPRLSRHWYFVNRTGPHLPNSGILGFREELDYPYFFDNLIDGQPSAVEIWLRNKHLIEDEFGWPRSGIPGQSDF